MARDIYQSKQTGAAAQVWSDLEGDQLVRTEIEAEIIRLRELLDLSETAKDAIRTVVPQQYDNVGNPIDYFDDYLQGLWERQSDLNEYFDYTKGPVEIGNTFQDDWFTPETVETFPGEDVLDSNLLMIDGINNNWWQWSSGSPPYVVEFRLREWHKRIMGVRLRNTTGDALASLLNVQVHTSGTLPGLDNSPDRFTVPFSMSLGVGGWQEFNFDQIAAQARYCRLTIGGTDNVNDEIRIREIAFLVGVRNL